MDKLRAIEVFVRVAECASFSRAAESLELANATVTSCIYNLEKNLGVTLIQRNTRHFRLTEEGALFLPRCQELLQSVDRAEAEIRSKTGEIAGTLRVEMPIAIGHALICPALPLFARRYPGLSVSVTLTNQPHNLIERGIDVAIRMDRIDDADLVARPIYKARSVVCASPGLARSHPIASPRDLDPRQCLGLLAEGRDTPRDWFFRRDGDEILVHPQGPLNFSSSDALIAAALQGAGFIHVLDVFANRYFKDGKLVAVLGGWETAIRTFYAVTSKSRFTTLKVKAFSEFLAEMFSDQRQPGTTRPAAVFPRRRAR